MTTRNILARVEKYLCPESLMLGTGDGVIVHEKSSNPAGSTN